MEIFGVSGIIVAVRIQSSLEVSKETLMEHWIMFGYPQSNQQLVPTSSHSMVKVVTLSLSGSIIPEHLDLQEHSPSDYSLKVLKDW